MHLSRGKSGTGSLAANAKKALARRSHSVGPPFERHQPVRRMNGPKVGQTVILKRVFPIDGLHGTAPLAVEFVQHLFRRRAARIEDAFQRFEVAALVAAELVDVATPPEACMRQLQAFLRDLEQVAIPDPGLEAEARHVFAQSLTLGRGLLADQIPGRVQAFIVIQ